MSNQLPAARAMLRSRHCLVTGGAGFIGSNLVDALLDCGAPVTVLDNFSTGDRGNLKRWAGDERLTLIEGDAADAAIVEAAVSGVDTIFHLAAMASVPRSVREPALCHAWTTTSTVQLLQAAHRQGIRRLVLASTSAVYGNSPVAVKAETTPTDPISPYAAAKLASEHFARAFSASLGLSTVILRFFNVFGPRQDPGSEYSAVIPRFVSRALAGESPTLYGDGEQTRDFVYVEDVIQANLLASTASGVDGEVFNIARGEPTTLWGLLEILQTLLGTRVEPLREPPREGDVRHSTADITRAHQRLGYEPAVELGEGLRRSIDYYRERAGHGG
ncbi:MAG: SDR family oxidoreductase [Planctomycetaceae bacterium]|nr:MAG: SDR family oxidoreductase [Planctomycetaceae bacterium]